MRSARSPCEDESVQLATHFAAFAAPQQTVQHLPGVEASSSPEAHLNFGQVLADQAGQQSDTRPAPLATGTPNIPPEFVSNNVSGSRPGLPLMAEIHGNSLAETIQQEAAASSQLRPIPGAAVAMSQGGSKAASSGTCSSSSADRSEDSGNSSIIKGKEHKSDEQTAVPVTAAPVEALDASHIPAEKLQPNLTVPLLPFTGALASSQTAASLQLTAQAIDGGPTVEANGKDSKMSESPVPEIGETAPQPDNIAANLASTSQESLASVETSDAAANRSGVVQMPTEATLDLPKGHLTEPPRANEANASYASVLSGAQEGSVTRGTVKNISGDTGPSTGFRVVQMEHSVLAQTATTATPPGPVTNGARTPGVDGGVDSSILSRLPHSSENTVNPYQKLDQGVPAPSMVLTAGNNRMAVGVHDPALGWVEIKTQSAAGQVAASLVTASSQTHASLAAQLPSLTQFLAERDVRVGSLAVEQQPAGSSDGGRAGSGDGQGSSAHRGSEASPGSTADSAAANVVGSDEIFDERPLSYISVRA
jgi:hypothetical protein